MYKNIEFFFLLLQTRERETEREKDREGVREGRRRGRDGGREGEREGRREREIFTYFEKILMSKMIPWIQFEDKNMIYSAGSPTISIDSNQEYHKEDEEESSIDLQCNRPLIFVISEIS